MYDLSMKIKTKQNKFLSTKNIKLPNIFELWTILSNIGYIQYQNMNCL